MTTNNFMRISVMALLLLAVSGCASTSIQPQANHHSADSDITASVEAAAKSNATLDASAMDVSTANGVVHLSGFVSSHAEVVAATDVARGITGVTAVENDMMVKTVR